MQQALELAAEAGAAGEVPVGAVLVLNGVVIGVGRNSPIQSCDPTAHAEINALRAAALTLGNYRLDDCTLYVTLEPCAMCCGSMLHSRLKRVVFGAAEPKTGCAGSVLNLFQVGPLNHQTQVEGGLLQQQSTALLQDFFKQKRAAQRLEATPLREDALRTPESCFERLADYPWAGHFICNLPSLAGLRLHYIDTGPQDGGPVYLYLHPIPGWSYSGRALIKSLLQQDARVVAPDLMGFGKSDKPKRQSMHTLAWHLNYMLELLERLDLTNVVLVLSDALHPLAQGLAGQAAQRIQGLLVQPLGAYSSTPESSHVEEALARDALNAPYPDAGHRAGERALMALALQQAKMQP